jgi:hypothetical protein
MNSLRAVFASIVLLGLGTGTALAHDIMKPSHGGQVAMSGETLFELVAAPSVATLYVSQDDEPVDSATLTAKLTFTTAGKKQEVALTAAGGNKFEAKGANIPKGTSVNVVLVNKTTMARTFATITTQ